MPEPYLLDTSTHYHVYSRGELDVFARVLANHAQVFQYFCAAHTHVKHEIHQMVQAYREQQV